MRLIPILLVLALPAAACASPLGGGRDPMKLLMDADANRDGAVTRAEFRDSRNRLFGRLDRNGDGFLSSADVPRRLARRRGEAGGRDQLMQALDANRDGRLSRPEFVDGRSLFDRADRDGDGVARPNELRDLDAALARFGR